MNGLTLARVGTFVVIFGAGLLAVHLAADWPATRSVAGEAVARIGAEATAAAVIA